MNIIANKWQILNNSNHEYIHLPHVDHPGYITIKAGNEGFIIDVMPDEGNEADASTYSFYEDLKPE